MRDAQRMAWVLDHFNLTQAKLARRLGYAPQFINDILHSRARISRECAAKMAAELGVDEAWCLTGKGGPWDQATTTQEPTTTTTQPGTQDEVGPVAPVRAEVRYRCGVCLCYLAEGEAYCPTCGRQLQWPTE